MRIAGILLLSLSLFALPLAAQQSTPLAKTYVVICDETKSSIHRYETNGAFKDSFAQIIPNDFPEAAVFGPDQNLYFTDYYTGKIERYNGDTGAYISQFAAVPHLGAGLTFGPDGNLYVVDRTDPFPSAVIKFDGATGAMIGEFVKRGDGGYTGPSGLTFGPDGDLYVTSGTVNFNANPNSGNPQILQFDGKTGQFKKVFVSTGSGGLQNPYSLLFGPDGNLYVASNTTHTVLRYNGKTGAPMGTFVTANSGGLCRPTGMAFGPDGNFYVASAYSGCPGASVGILRYDSNGNFKDIFIPQGSGNLTGPTSIIFYTFESQIAFSGRSTSVATDSAGNRMVVWADNNQIKAQGFNAAGIATGSPNVISSSSSIASNPHVAAMSTGSYLVAWQEYSSLGKSGVPLGASHSNIGFTPMPGTGAPSTPPKTISAPPGGSSDVTPAITPVQGHLKAVVVWNRTNSGGQGTGLMGTVVGADGSVTGTEMRLSAPATTASDETPAVASDGNHQVTIAWARRQVDNSAANIDVQTLDGNLNPSTSPVVIDDGSQGAPKNPAVSSNSDGRTVVVWERGATQATNSPFVPLGASGGNILRMPISAGQPAGPATPANNDPTRHATSPGVAVSDSGNATVVWQYGSNNGGSGIYGRSFDAAGNASKNDFVITDAANSAESFNAPAVSVDATGNATVSTDKTVSGNAAGVFTRTKAADALQPCSPNDTTLCLLDSRFALSVTWKAFDNTTGVGHAVALTKETGYFWFFGASNVELVIKVLDGRPLNQKFWVFYGALSNVEYTITVIDTQTGASKTYVNPSGAFGSVGDTSAFSGGIAPDPGASAAPAIPQRTALPPVKSATCTTNDTTLCLNGSRFRLTATWKAFDGTSGVGHAVVLTNETGYFWFFGASNVELIIKVLDGRPLNGKYWVFYGALSNVEYTITVTDTQTGAVKTYFNPSGNFASIGDTSAFSEHGATAALLMRSLVAIDPRFQ